MAAYYSKLPQELLDEVTTREFTFMVKAYWMKEHMPFIILGEMFSRKKPGAEDETAAAPSVGKQRAVPPNVSGDASLVSRAMALGYRPTHKDRGYLIRDMDVDPAADRAFFAGFTTTRRAADLSAQKQKKAKLF